MEWLKDIGPFVPLILLALRPVRMFLKRLWYKTIGKRGAQLDRIEDRLDAELTANGGSSLKDAIGRIETRQHQIDAFLRTSLHLHETAIVRTDANGKVTAVNREYKRLTGASLDEVRGDGWINVIAMHDRDRVRANWDNAVAEGREYHDDITFLDHHGNEFTAHTDVYRELDYKGNIHGYLGVIVPASKNPCIFTEECVTLLKERVLEDQNVS